VKNHPVHTRVDFLIDWESFYTLFDGDASRLYRWYEDGGSAHVGSHLGAMNLNGFDCKAPPPKSPAFWSIVQTGEAPESGELRDIVEHLDKKSMTLNDLVTGAQDLSYFDMSSELQDRKNRRSMPHKLERVGYSPVRNPDAEDGLFKIAGKRQTVYAQMSLSISEQIKAARFLATSHI